MRALLIFWLALPLAVAQYGPLPKRYRGPSQLGSYWIQPATPVRELFRVLGRPLHPGAKYFCYRSRDGATFLWFEPRAHFPAQVGDLLLSSFPNCRGAAVEITSARIGAWRTSQGVGLGSPKAAIVRAYGLPYERWSVESNNPAILHNPTGLPNPGRGIAYREWGYESSEDMRFVHFGLAQGRVAFIFIGNNE